MKTFETLLIVAAILNARSLVLSQETQQYCVPIRPVIQDGENQTNFPISQGPPGQPGSVGPTGAKGDRGDDGKCLCDLSEDKQLKKELSEMKKILNNLERVAKESNYYKFCGVGIADSRIPDSAMTASSSVNEQFTAYKARLGSDTYWHPTYPPAVFYGEWLQVDMGQPTTIVGIVTQGRPPEPHSYTQYLTSYKILYGNSTSALYPIQDPILHNDVVFSGNIDRNSFKLNKFSQPITAQYFRVEVVDYHGVPSLRLEYLIC